MSLRDTITSQQLLAVSLAVIMLVSMGGMAFIGGAGAQTGGTFDGFLDEQEIVNDDLAITDDGDVVLVGPADPNEDGAVDADSVSVNADGSINISDDSGSLAGVGLTPDRVAAFDDDLEFTVGEEADFLDAAVEGNLSVDSENENANATIFADFDPQSDFSQINVTDSEVDGTHDFIVIGQNESIDAQFETDSSGGFVAASVDNNDSEDAQLLVDDAESFEAVVDELVDDDDNEQPVENEFLENVLFTAVTDGEEDTVEAVTLGEESAFEPDQTLHSEKITLDDGDERFFASVSEAVNASADGDTITVDHGNYDALEGQNVTVDTDVSIQTTERVNDGVTIDRVDTDDSSIADPDHEAIINTSVEVEAGATLDNVVVQNGTEAAVNITDGDAELTDVVVNYTGTTDAVNATASGATITGSTVMANKATVFEAGEVGLELNENAGANVTENFFAGFETQVANVSDETNATALFNAHEEQFEDDRAQSAVPFSGDDVTSTSLFGSINAADDAASDGDTINVSAGTYDEGGTVVVDTDDITVDGAGDTIDGAGDTTAIENDVELNSSTSTTLTNAQVNGSVTAVTDDNSDATVTVDAVTLPGSNVTVQEGNDVTIQSVTFDDAGVDAVNITAEDPNVTVDDVEVNNLTGGTGISIADAGDVIDVTNNDVNSPTGDDPDGINVSSVIVDSDVDVTGNDVTGIGNGTALILTEDPNNGEAERFNVDDNEFRAGDDGTDFTGIQYELTNTTGTNITANTIVGADVSGGADSIGINFVNVTVTEGDAGGITGPDITDATALTIRDNVLNGHARVINSEDEEVLASDYTNILDLGSNDELNNTVGTVVLGPNGETYSETYGDRGEINLSGDTDTYLPGSVSEAADLVGVGPYDDVTLEVQDIDGVTGPDTYVDETVTYPNIDSLTITGEGSDRTPEVESRFVINETDALNNHALENLSVNNTDADNPAINVTEGHNSQSTFENLDVTSDESGLVVNATETDVNVIEVRDSDFDVAADGIVLADGADDRDGFVIENNTVTGDGIDTAGSIGLDLSQVEKPGKAGLETNLSVTDNYVTDFEVQVAGSTGTDGDDITALNFTSEQFSDEFDANGAITVDNNEFGQQVLVFEADAEPQNSNDENVSLNATNLFGSIQAAHGAVNADDDVIRVYDVTSDGVNYDAPSGTSTTYAEPLTISENNVTVRGPAFDESAGAAFRTDEALISGTVELNDVGDGVNSSAAFTGFTVVADDSNDNVVNVTGNTGNLTVANTAVSAAGNETTGLPDEEVNGLAIDGTNGNGDISVESVFIGDHDAAETTNSSVVVEASSTLEIVDSTLTSDVDTADGIGVEYTADAGNTTISDTTISTHAEAGVDAFNHLVNVTVTDSSVIQDNDGVGFNATGTEGSTFVVEDSSELASNNATGLFADNNVTVTVDSATVTDHDATGVEIENATADSSVVSSAIDVNDVGLAVNASEVTPEVTGNNFTNVDTDISTTDSAGATLDASLNYFGTETGPEAASAAGVDDTVVYDPFLTEDQTGSAVSDVETTTEFGHDIKLPADTIRTVGIPATLADDANTVGDIFDPDLNGTVYAWNASSNQFERPSVDDEVEAFDAFVVENDEDSPDVAKIEYQSEFDRNDFVPDTFEFEAGPNFVPAQEVGTVDEALFAGGDTDVVALPFASGDNLYGDTRSDQVRDEFVTPTEDGFSDNFRSGVGDQTVHPHVGYFVIVNEESNVGQEVTERITTADTVTTASNVAEQTGATSAEYQVSDLSVTANSTSDNASVVVDIENIGDLDGDAQDVTATALTGIEVDATESVTLNAGESTTLEFTLDGTDLDAGDQVRVEVTTDDDSDKATATAA